MYSVCVCVQTSVCVCVCVAHVLCVCIVYAYCTRAGRDMLPLQHMGEAVANFELMIAAKCSICKGRGELSSTPNRELTLS